MARRKIKPEVLRPLILVVAIIIALFVLQFWRPIPPDLRPQQEAGYTQQGAGNSRQGEGEKGRQGATTTRAAASQSQPSME